MTMNDNEFKKWMTESDDKFRYMMLGRMLADCRYFLGYGLRSTKNLWALDVDKHLRFMDIIYGMIDQPDWLTVTEFNAIKSAMTTEA